MLYRKLVALSILVLIISGCQKSEAGKIAAPQSSIPPAVPEEKPSTSPTVGAIASPTPAANPEAFEDATSKAIGAATIAQSSQSKEDWQLVSSQWGQAIMLMKAVAKDDPNHGLAQKKIAEYQKNLAYANKKALNPGFDVKPVSIPEPTNDTQSRVVTVSNPPVSRVSPKAAQPKPATRKIDDYRAAENNAKQSVQKFMNQYFEQTINKGGKGYAYWCDARKDLASSLFSPVSWRILDVSAYPNATSASVRANIESSTQGGRPIRQNWNFYLEKGDTVLGKSLLKDGSREAYDQFKAESGGWCLAVMSES